MLFNSIEFAIFFPIAVTVYFLIAQRWRVHWLLAASCVFYMAFIPVYILILVVTILIDYVAGIIWSACRILRRKNCCCGSAFFLPARYFSSSSISIFLPVLLSDSPPSWDGICRGQ